MNDESDGQAPISRRSLLEGVVGMLAATPFVRAAQPARPNILWLTAEDIGPHLHCCGDEYSITPNLDRLAARGCVYSHAWSNAPVCAPARTTIITGVYPTSTGSEHMRSMTRMPPGWKMFPGYLRDAGYYCTNNAKEDYNLEKPESTWDDSSKNGHWRNRKAGQPFFAVFNNETTHEGQVRRSAKNEKFVHDPRKARLPAYHPDTIEARKDWAQYYDNITTMDTQVQARLDELQQDGLAEDTIIVFFGDNGPGLPRLKRFPYDSGNHVAMFAVFPEKYRHLAPKGFTVGGTSARLIGFVDLAPTMLSLAGIKPPDFMQGHAFAGPHEAAAPTYLFGFRGRMDERHDLMRTARDLRYSYIRNYNPHRIYGQHIDYLWATPTTPVWERLYLDGKLKAPRTYFWETKPAEELYDLQTDRDEVKNLAASPAHRAVLERFRKAHAAHELAIKDVGLLPESEIHTRSAKSSPYEMGHDPEQYPFERVFAAAELATSGRNAATTELARLLQDRDSAVRYWGAMGVLVRGREEVARMRPALLKALEDGPPSVKIAAAEALGRYGTGDDVRRSLVVLLELASVPRNGVHVSTQALGALDQFALEDLRTVQAQIEALVVESSGATAAGSSDSRAGGNPRSLKTFILGKLKS